MTRSIQINDQNFTMHPSRVLFWEEKSMVLISDVHLGKVSHFRKFGAAVPQQAVQKNFDMLNEVVDFFNPKSIVFMGDLFHSSLNNEWQLFEGWVKKQSATLVLVAGNHDIIAPSKYEDVNIKVVSEIQLDGYLFTHHPEKREGFFNFSGHIHPAIKLTGLGRQSVRLPCFFKSQNQLILPAFGEFTGTYTVTPQKGNEVFAVLGDAIIAVPLRERKNNGPTSK
ncbi:ligase-associated DNA damage response endonuclease PdeM [Costertonia aggregata]|uniref:Ligase-associated DNA damage response endonuclease PdeM n=1 Tax=Costertonia aggregata TaxID=343403 RepID=A0A7H9AN49_9FLAO|nr:ligase-associated DNA damage response endonuclease PdeM [Costertonia aggregata]QLG44876.1 ligase-associated DNA damage response endonuclease PdeM [Costertonia aggregata]